MTSPCPCSSGRAFGECCGPYLEGKAHAPTAEALMRSRYAAYATGNIDYLAATLRPGTLKGFDRRNATEWSRTSVWQGLTVKAVEKGLAHDSEGIVEFVARFRQKGEDQVHHETARFVKENGRWYYESGARGKGTVHVEKIARNAPCPCGSGKKYKKCCGAKAA
jgi:SEC-C motif-containing protein